jgi:putative ABC transport system permease protein
LTSASVREGVSLALDSLRANKIRAALTILGIVIGVATVMTMAALIVGVRTSITDELNAFGPNNFTVERYDQTQARIVNVGSGPAPWEGKPPITMAEAELIAELPGVRSVTSAVYTGGDLRAGTSELTGVSIRGRGYLWTDYSGGEFVMGRNFLPSEERRGSLVAVLSEAAAQGLFGQVNPVGRDFRVGGEQFEVIGVFREQENIFTGAAPVTVTVPTTVAVQRLRANADWQSLLVVPASGYTQLESMDQVISALRAARGLPPAEENNFAVIRQEAFLALFNQVTWVFFLVMLVLSSIGLIVGGVGVIAIMMIAVTERTREIGVRKALGATRREILWQFLVEAVTVTVIGGVIGIALGGAGAILIGVVTPLPVSVPLWSVAAALAVSAVSGIGFGLYPAHRASRLDPVEALRYE